MIAKSACYVHSVRPLGNSCTIAASSGRISVKFYINGLVKICGEKPDLAKIGQKYRTLCVRTTYALLFPATLNRHKSALFE